MRGHRVTITATEQGFVVDNGKEARQMPKGMDLPLLVAVTRLEAVLKLANPKGEDEA